ncbi:Hypothetical protein CINCED_3A017910 [Cinara cedri]|uniref:Pheromone/general odorant binding protein n=1 Tax=Cinara cedri TaxID=506608 RepID=A0A5E4MUL9_9HEMI|nr:Hypothetical protein CINCED_3A017910 [Cinara cedri]
MMKVCIFIFGIFTINTYDCEVIQDLPSSQKEIISTNLDGIKMIENCGFRHKPILDYCSSYDESKDQYGEEALYHVFEQCPAYLSIKGCSIECVEFFFDLNCKRLSQEKLQEKYNKQENDQLEFKYMNFLRLSSIIA